MYLSISLEVRNVWMAADQGRYFFEPESLVKVIEELFRSSAMEMVKVSGEVTLGLFWSPWIEMLE